VIPVDLDRDAAREAASRELADPAYDAAEPALFERIGRWFVELLTDLFTGVAAVTPGGITGLLVLAALAVIVVVVVRLRAGRVARGARVRAPLFERARLSAADHRRAAELAADRGDLAEAVRERFRALARELEERGVLDEVSGRTVDEIAAQAGLALPEHAAGLRGAARIFDDVVYGDRPATVDGYRSVVELDDRLRPRARVSR
jgi:hypothetical protein